MELIVIPVAGVVAYVVIKDQKRTAAAKEAAVAATGSKR
jgi:hypothetical protein